MTLIDNPRKMQNIFNSTKIWKHFEGITSEENKAMVRCLIDYVPIKIDLIAGNNVNFLSIYLGNKPFAQKMLAFQFI